MSKALLTITLPGDDTPCMKLFDDDMVLAPSEEERPAAMALLIEALGILAGLDLRRPDKRTLPKLRVVRLTS